MPMFQGTEQAGCFADVEAGKLAARHLSWSFALLQEAREGVVNSN